MNSYIGMTNGTEQNLIAKYNEIKTDLLSNSKDLLNRYEYYTKKYRGNRLDDINIGVWEEARNEYTVQMFLRNRSGQYVKEVFRFDGRGSLLTENKLSNLA